MFLFLFLSYHFQGFAVLPWRNPDLLQHSAQDPIVHLLRNEVCQEASHVVKVLGTLTNFAVEDAQVEGIQLVAFQVVLAGLHKLFHVEVAGDAHYSHHRCQLDLEFAGVEVAYEFAHRCLCELGEFRDKGFAIAPLSTELGVEVLATRCEDDPMRRYRDNIASSLLLVLLCFYLHQLLGEFTDVDLDVCQLLFE